MLMERSVRSTNAIWSFAQLYQNVPSSPSARHTQIGAKMVAFQTVVSPRFSGVRTREQNNVALMCVCGSYGRIVEIKAGRAVLSACHESAFHVQPFCR